MVPSVCPMCLTSYTSCHQSPHITTYSPSFYLASFLLNFHVILPVTLSSSAPWQPLSSSLCLSPLVSEFDHFFILMYCNLKPNFVSTPSNTISSQSGIRVRAMPGGVGINLLPYHSSFLLLPACLIKLPPSPMHT